MFREITWYILAERFCLRVVHLSLVLTTIETLGNSVVFQLYALLNLEEFERTFSAYQKKQDEADDSKQSGKTPQKTKELSVIDGRRAQNCTILLSKLKISNEEIKTAVLNMDQHEDIPKDMLEQVRYMKDTYLVGYLKVFQSEYWVIMTFLQLRGILKESHDYDLIGRSLMCLLLPAVHLLVLNFKLDIFDAGNLM